jgi:hypothetical protein
MGFSLLPKIVVRLSPWAEQKSKPEAGLNQAQNQFLLRLQWQRLQGWRCTMNAYFCTFLGVVRVVRRACWQGLPLKNNISQ